MVKLIALPNNFLLSSQNAKVKTEQITILILIKLLPNVSSFPFVCNIIGLFDKAKLQMFKPLFTKRTVAEKDMEATASALLGVTVLEQLLNVFSYTCHPYGDQDTLHPV